MENNFTDNSVHDNPILRGPVHLQQADKKGAEPTNEHGGEQNGGALRSHDGREIQVQCFNGDEMMIH